MPKTARERRTRVCLYTFHPLVLQEIRRQLESHEFQIQARPVSPDGVADQQALAVPRASVYLIDGHPRQEQTEALITRVLQTHSAARLVVMTEKFNDRNAFPLLRLGTKGLVKYADSAQQLPRALRVVASGGYWIPRMLLSRFIEASLVAPSPRRLLADVTDLTPREREALERLLQNFSNKEIARQLHVSERTAKFHVSNLLSKFGVRRRADLILMNFARPKNG